MDVLLNISALLGAAGVLVAAGGYFIQTLKSPKAGAVFKEAADGNFEAVEGVEYYAPSTFLIVTTSPKGDVSATLQTIGDPSKRFRMRVQPGLTGEKLKVAFPAGAITTLDTTGGAIPSDMIKSLRELAKTKAGSPSAGRVVPPASPGTAPPGTVEVFRMTDQGHLEKVYPSAPQKA